VCYLYYKVRYLYDFICVVIRVILGLHCGPPPTYFLLWQPCGILIVIFIVISSCTFPLTFLFPFLLKHSNFFDFRRTLSRYSSVGLPQRHPLCSPCLPCLVSYLLSARGEERGLCFIRELFSTSCVPAWSPEFSIS